MKTEVQNARATRAYILLVTMIFLGLGVLLLMTIMNWTSETSRLTDRHNEYYASAAAAEAATEKILVHISRDYISGGNSTVNANLGNYATMVPTASEYSNWGNYTFYNPKTGASGGVYVDQYQAAALAVMTGEYSGLNGYQAVYRIVANAALNNSRNGNLRAGVEQYVGTEAIPLFQFAIFYNQDLEMNPSPAMVVTGRVHSNGSIYTLPSTSLVFSNDVTAVGSINLTYMPGDPSGNRGITGMPNVTFDGEHDGGQNSLNLPIGTNSSTTNVYQILQIPPTTEAINSALGSQRMYNKSDLLILVSNSGVTVKSGPFLGSSPVTVQASQWTNFITTTNVIFDARQNTNVQTVQLNISNFDAWVSSSNALTPLLQAADEAAVSKVFVADMRTGGSYEPAVYLNNGAQLPPNGLTIATPDPVYIQGDYNVTTDGGLHTSIGVNSTTYTYPSAVMGDAVTILSDHWNNTSSTAALTSSSRTATDTTVNTALLVGIDPTGTYNGTAVYSGGVENFPRFLENWSGQNFWYNGSMVAMFNSQIATVPWGYSKNVYNPPNRNWAFDVNFNNPNKLPPGTPLILYMQRLNWAFQAPGVVPP